MPVSNETEKSMEAEIEAAARKIRISHLGQCDAHYGVTGEFEWGPPPSESPDR